MEKRKSFIVTWKHQLFIQAKSERMARRIFDKIDLGRLSEEVQNHFGVSGHSILGIEKVEKI